MEHVPDFAVVKTSDLGKLGGKSLLVDHGEMVSGTVVFVVGHIVLSECKFR